MRALIVLAFLLFTPTSLGKVEKADITVLQVNSQWNKQHNIDLNGLIGCEVQFAWLEDQSDNFQEASADSTYCYLIPQKQTYTSMVC